MHHEKIDGSGYPFGKIGDEIDLFSMIVEICDIYEAMTADRIYRARISPLQVLDQFDNKVFGCLKCPPCQDKYLKS